MFELHISQKRNINGKEESFEKTYNSLEEYIKDLHNGLLNWHKTIEKSNTNPRKDSLTSLFDDLFSISQWAFKNIRTSVENSQKTITTEELQNTINKLKEGNDLIDFSRYTENLNKEAEEKEKRAEARKEKIKEVEQILEDMGKIKNTITFIKTYLKNVPNDEEALTDIKNLEEKNKDLWIKSQNLKAEIDNLSK